METPRPRFILVEPSAKDLNGHFYAYLDALQNTIKLAGYEALGFTNSKCKIVGQNQLPFFKLPYIRIFTPQDLGRNLRKILHLRESRFNQESRLAKSEFTAYSFRILNRIIAKVKNREFNGFIEKNCYTNDQVIFITAGLREIEILQELSNKYSKINFHLILRHTPLGAYESKFIFTSLQVKNKLNIAYYSDTPELCLEWNKILNQGVSLVSVPVNIMQPSENFDRNLIGFPGELRAEKGLNMLPELLKQIKSVDKNLGIVIQSKNPVIRNQNSFDRNIYQMPLNLKLQEYSNLLWRIRVAPLLYQSENYAYRSSGVFYELLATGSIPIVPTGTSMSGFLYRSFPNLVKELNLTKIDSLSIDGLSGTHTFSKNYDDQFSKLLVLTIDQLLTPIKILFRKNGKKIEHIIYPHSEEKVRLGIFKSESERLIRLEVLGHGRINRITLEYHLLPNAHLKSLIYTDTAELTEHIMEACQNDAQLKLYLSRLWVSQNKLNSYENVFASITRNAVLP